MVILFHVDYSRTDVDCESEEYVASVVLDVLLTALVTSDSWPLVAFLLAAAAPNPSDDAKDSLLLTMDDVLSDFGIFLLSTDTVDTGTLSDFGIFVALLMSTDLEGILSDFGTPFSPLPDVALEPPFEDFVPFVDFTFFDLLARSLLALLLLLSFKLFFLDLRDFVLFITLLLPLSDLLLGMLASTGLTVGDTGGRIPKPKGLLVGDSVSSTAGVWLGTSEGRSELFWLGMSDGGSDGRSVSGAPGEFEGVSEMRGISIDISEGASEVEGLEDIVGSITNEGVGEISIELLGTCVSAFAGASVGAAAATGAIVEASAGLEVSGRVEVGASGVGTKFEHWHNSLNSKEATKISQFSGSMNPPRPALSASIHVSEGLPAGSSNSGGRGTTASGLSILAVASPQT